MWNCGDRNVLRVWQGIPSAMWAAQLAGQTSLKMHLGTWRQLGFKAVCLPELRRETCNPSSMHESLLDVIIIGYLNGYDICRDCCGYVAGQKK